MKRRMGSINVYAIKEVSRVNIIKRTKPFPNILPARKRSPCPSAMAANGAPPPPTIAEKEEIRIMREVVTPTPANASVPMPGICPIYTRSTILYNKLTNCAATAGSAILKTSGNIRSVPSRSSYLFIIPNFFF